MPITHGQDEITLEEFPKLPAVLTTQPINKDLNSLLMFRDEEADLEAALMLSLAENVPGINQGYILTMQTS